MTDGPEVLIAGALLAAALLAALFASRIRVPGLILFLALGMLVGSDALGWVEFSDYELARDVGVIALILIILEGGLNTGASRLRPVWQIALSLATVGTLATAVLTGLAAALLFDFSLLESMLLGSIVASTDAAAIFGVLRYSTLRRRIARILEGEAGANDPVAILLVLGFIEWIQVPGYTGIDLVVSLVGTLLIGFVVGVAAALAGVEIFRRVRLATEGLYPVASIAAAAITYGTAETVGGSGFLAVYLVGLALGSADIPARRTITAFHEGVGWIAQVVLFLTLGLLVFPAELPSVAVEGTLLGLVLAFVARPLAVLLATAPFRFTVAERVIVSWAGLRGAVPVVLATFAVLAGIEHSVEFFNIVFFSVLISTLLQGATFEWAAGRLGLTTSEPAVAPRLLEADTIRSLGADVVEHEIQDGDAAEGLRIRELGLPRGALVSVVVREGRALPPRGSTRVRAGDRLHILVLREHADEVPELTYRWRSGPRREPVRRARKFSARRPVFTARPWREEDGDPGAPSALLGEDVEEILRIREDQPGTLVLLADGRYAVTGPALICGAASELRGHAERRLRLGDVEDRDWWEQVIGALEAERGFQSIM